MLIKSKEQDKHSWYQHFYIALILEKVDNAIRKNRQPIKWLEQKSRFNLPPILFVQILGPFIQKIQENLQKNC